MMKDHEVDRILSREEEILPSSGFADSVMDVVRSEASIPPPIPFPWKRALPGILCVSAALLFPFAEIAIQVFRGDTVTNTVSINWMLVLHTMLSTEGIGIALAIVMTLASLVLSTHPISD